MLDKEALLLGYNTRNKSLIVLGCLAIPVVQLLRVESLGGCHLPWRRSRFIGSSGRWPSCSDVVYLAWKHDLHISMIWFVKPITDPFTDMVAYFPRWPQRA